MKLISLKYQSCERDNDSMTACNNQRTNGPVNAHLRSAAYTNKFVFMVFDHSARADEALGPSSFFRIINILSISQFPAVFFLSNA